MRRTARIALLTAGVLLLWTAGGWNRALVRARTEATPGAAQPLAQAPPPMIFTTVVLGGFRGIIADVLWLRISYLQERGEYFEIVQLADWISKLTPRSAETWSFHAWNLAFNVTAAMAHPEDRWRWVQNGLRLLRDEGLAYNPAEPLLYCDLSWLYLFKIGGSADSAASFYRLRLAEEMTALFGGRRPDEAALAGRPGLAEELQRRKLNVRIMRDLETSCGPLDWRLPETHALYWAWQGARRGPEKIPIQCHRLIYHSLTALALRGRLDFRPEQGVYNLRPDPALLPPTLAAYETAMRDYPIESTQVAFSAFLRRAVVVFYDTEREAARGLYQRLQSRFPSPQTACTLDEFVTRTRAEP
jgi:hypothetical protein